MNNVSSILNAMRAGDLYAQDELIRVTYVELRTIAARKMANEKAGHTLQPTALVHEAYLRLLGPDGRQPAWNTGGHFFSAAAEAMRRILIESARRKLTVKRGKHLERVTFSEDSIKAVAPSKRLLAVDEALARLEQQNPEFARIVKLRYFAGMTIAEISTVLNVSERTISRIWKSAKVWLYREIGE